MSSILYIVKLQKRLIEIRKERQVTQEELANVVGVTRQTIISIEKGYYIPSVLLAMKISKYFQLPTDKLFLYE